MGISLIDTWPFWRSKKTNGIKIEHSVDFPEDPFTGWATGAMAAYLSGRDNPNLNMGVGFNSGTQDGWVPLEPDHWRKKVSRHSRVSNPWLVWLFSLTLGYSDQATNPQG